MPFSILEQLTKLNARPAPPTPSARTKLPVLRNSGAARAILQLARTPNVTAKAIERACDLPHDIVTSALTKGVAKKWLAKHPIPDAGRDDPKFTFTLTPLGWSVIQFNFPQEYENHAPQKR